MALVLLTLFSAMVSSVKGPHTSFGIIALAGLKFIGVSFYFMELKQANAFWKGSILIFLALFSAVLLIII